MAETKQGSSAPFLAFTNDSETLAVLKQFAGAQSWKADDIIFNGDINTASDFLKNHTSPQVLCVDIQSADTAAASLDKLADVCDPSIKVIITGKVNEYSFYCWLIEVGISSYLLKPFTIAALETAYRKASDTQAGIPAAAAETKKSAKVIAVIGSRGGVGATTVSVNLAWILSHSLEQKTALLDFDPQLGTVALAMDLEPGKGLRDALEKPDRIDGLFLDRVMVRIDDSLSILSTEESLEESISPGEAAAEAILTQAKPKFAFIIIDLPRNLTSFTRHALKHADHVICVTEYSIMGLRESLRYLDYTRDILKIPTPIFVANRVGMSGKHQMPKSEFEKGLGVSISHSIPFTLDAHAAATAGEVFSETSKNAPASKALHFLAEHFIPESTDKKPTGKLKGLFSFATGGK